MNYLVMTVGVCVFFSQEVEVFLSALEVVGAEHERAVLDLGRIAPVLAVDDNLHALLDEFGLEVGVRGFVHENLRGVIRVGVRVLVTLLSGLSELLDQVGIVLDGLVIGDDADGVGVAGHAIVRLGEAVELRAVHVACTPSHVA